jgi:pyruvate kinase
MSVLQRPRVTPPALALSASTLDGLKKRLRAIRAEALDEEARQESLLRQVHFSNRLSARNLIHYLVLRRGDMRQLQADLAWVGLSSLGRSESHVLVSLDRVLAMLALATADEPGAYDHAAPVGFRQGDELLQLHTAKLLGAGRPHRRVCIAVTLPAETAGDARLCDGLVQAGMDVARINCAHDDPDTWHAMIVNVREAALRAGQEVRILMDLAGPKLRSGEVVGGAVPARIRRGESFLLAEEGRQVPEQQAGSCDWQSTCPVPEVFSQVAAGAAVWFDDGRIGGRVEERGRGWLRIRITHAKPEGTKLRANKGINLPDTVLTVPTLRDNDLQALEFVARHADAVALSFVQREEDVVHLQEELARLDGSQLGVVLKIETRAGFENLPRLLVTAMRTEHYGVMIARGDLAVEMGFERLAEVQEEILWFAEAAHAPTIWATQVLETLAKTGAPSRAEVTDAAMSSRAEAVLLNKGTYILDTIAALDDILARMAEHQAKKRALMRLLQISGNL